MGKADGPRSAAAEVEVRLDEWRPWQTQLLRDPLVGRLCSLDLKAGRVPVSTVV